MAVGDEPKVIRRATRKTLVYESAADLRALIFGGEIPPGTPVPEEATAHRLGIARSTAREVLTLLEFEGLLTRAPSTRILHVTQLSLDDIADIYRARRFLEIAAVEALANASAELVAAYRAAIAEVRAALDLGDPDLATRADWACHSALIACLGSQHLTDAFHSLTAKLHLAVASIQIPSEDYTAAQDHQEILESATGGRVDRARAIIARHLGEAEQELMDTYADRGE